MAVAAIIINVVLVLLLAPLFEGVVRKLKAVVHSRKGPPLLQPYIDVFKLLGKEDLTCTRNFIFRAAPVMALAAFVCAAAVMPMWTDRAGETSGDMVNWIYFLSLGAAAIILMAFASGNPFATTGGTREVMMLLSAEPIVVTALIVAAMKSGSMRLGDMMVWNALNGASVSMVCAGAALFLALQGALGKLPFDIPEAEQEVAGGPLIEISGPSLAVTKMALLVRQLLYCFILVQIFVPWPAVSGIALGIVIALVKVTIVFVLSAVIEAVSPRLRIDQSLTYMSRVLFVALTAVAFAAIGV